MCEGLARSKCTATAGRRQAVPVRHPHPLYGAARQLLPTLENLSTALADGRLLAWTWNGVVVTALAVAACTVISALAAYAFAQMEFPGYDLLLNIFIAISTRRQKSDPS